MKAIVTGGEGGIGRALCERLRSEGYDVQSLDLATGFDVASWEAWQEIGPVDVACLNAGVITGELTVENYHRAVAVNVDGVVLGVLRLTEVMAEGATAGHWTHHQTVAVARPDTNLIPPATQYGATLSKAEKGNPSKYAAFAILCIPLQHLSDHS